MSAICDSPCLTACEREALATVLDQPVEYIFHTEAWTCRAAAVGTLPPDFEAHSGDLYCAALLVAMLQLVGGVSTILPANTWEYVFYFVAILTGTILLSAVQGRRLSIAAPQQHSGASA